MSAWISKLVLHNYRRFSDYEILFNKEKNVIVGDNEAGKSSILTAIDLVISGSDTKVKAIGIDNLFRRQTVEEFLKLEKGQRTIGNLPILCVEMYLEDVTDLPNISNLHGKFKDDMKSTYGLRMLCVPNSELDGELKDYLDTAEGVFPFDFYKVEFLTFGNHHYSGYRRFLRHLTIDNSTDRFDYAEKGFVRDAYQLHVSELKERAKLESSYRLHKNNYEVSSLKTVNAKLATTEEYRFGIKHGIQANLQTDLTIYRDNISIDSLGLGERVFIKTKFSLNNKKSKYDPEVVLIEEPENHLSHNKMHKLIELIKDSKEAQIFIATHSNMVSSRLDLRNCIFVRKGANKPVSLKALDKETAKFFEKAPTVTLLDFVLADKVILVEGAAEYMLVHKFYSTEYGDPGQAGIYIASIGGLSFKRYMEIAKLLGIKLAAIRDNDRNPDRTCVKNYEKYVTDNIRVFFESDSTKHTFEVCVYEGNKGLCDEIFSEHDGNALDFMLSSKAEAAFILSETAKKVNIPQYILEAFKWIKE